MKEKQLIILGAGNSTVEIIDLIEDINKRSLNRIKIIGILDDNKNLLNKKISNIPIIGNIKEMRKFKKENFFIGIQSYKNRFKRSEFINSIKDNIKRFITIIHPSSIIGSTAKIGRGSLIGNNCNIYSNSSVGNFCNISANVSIAPKSNIKNNCFLGFNVIIGYNSTIEKNTYMGMKSSVLENIKIKQGSRILPNTLVHKNFNKKKGIIFGQPSKLIGIEN